MNRIHPEIADLSYKIYVNEENGLTFDSIKLDEMKRRLFEAREKRIHPHKDDKILTSWNGLMIAALAKGAKVLQEQKYREMAERNVEFITKHLVREDGRLLARYREGEAAYPGYVDDYAFLVWGLLELYEASFKEKYLELAIHFTDEMLRLFWDHTEGGLFFYGSDGENLILRPKEIYDGATPSGNSVAAFNLLRLAKITARNDYLEKGEGILLTFSSQISHDPFAYTMMLQALLFVLQDTKEIVFTGTRNEHGIPELAARLQSVYLPEAVLIYHDEQNPEKIRAISPYIVEQRSLNNQPTIYICENYSCHEPTTDIEAAIHNLRCK